MLQDIIYSNDVRFRIEKNRWKNTYIQTKEAKGKSPSECKKRAEQKNTAIKLKEKLILDNYFITDLKNKFRNQERNYIIRLQRNIIKTQDDEKL
jgi:hypothetical protein